LPLAPIPAASATLPHEDVRASAEVTDQRLFLRWLFEAAGLRAHHYRPETLHRRIPACLRQLRVTNLAEARRLLERDRSKIASAIGALVIGVTSFFRDESVFTNFTGIVLPALPRPPQRRRIWSVGCSDGEEVYSVAVLLAEAGLLPGSHLLGTDCRAPAIARAREALYGAAALRTVPSRCWDKYFLKDQTQLRIAPQLRAAAHWRVADVTQTREPGGWDVILCRNVVMYLRPDVAGAVWHEFERVLRPGGFLILGKAERPTGTPRLSLVAPCIYRRS
jgi:chemotaxis methyl-accepting protein methylase